MTEQKTEEQHGEHKASVPLASTNETPEAGLNAYGAMFERRRIAIASCHLAVKAMEQGTRALMNDAMNQAEKITGQPNTMLFAMLPPPSSQSFANLLIPAKGSVELAKARWKYEILYSTATPLEQVYERLITLKAHMNWDVSQPLLAREKNNFSLRRVESLLSSLEAIVSILDRLSEKIGAERFEVNEAILARWGKASENGRTAMVAEAWGAAKVMWLVEDYQKTRSAKQLRMLRVLMRYRAVEPILEPWSKLLEVVAELRECYLM